MVWTGGRRLASTEIPQVEPQDTPSGIPMFSWKVMRKTKLKEDSLHIGKLCSGKYRA